ncbi:UDP-N-acetylglucosamine transporter, putative [Eimeria acervulina]|uniref:UDP-N-acetylglucosamine transporter, putative n=1 Tax=Eimeria acervulina TaxID=5801 RepID=U6GI41_EIMAC|nr:UDP-N-acetylglucosamine transporter, putative [Eimeria acervulina]CDI78249.1 UDP-N-acetylglucosamine transporter, putative [Eimeria acervulina]
MSTSKAKTDPRFLGVPMRWVALLALVGQTVAGVSVLRLSRSGKWSGDVPYLTTTAVVSAEVVKLLTSLPLLWFEQNCSFRQTAAAVYRGIIANPIEMAKAGVPGLLYAVQNNLIFISLSNLSGAMYQVTYQLKILTTALLSVLILGRRLSLLKWSALILLFLGVSLIQYPTASEAPKALAAGGRPQNAFVGLVAVLCASLTSGLAGVYLEKLLKEKTTTIWINNMQLAVYGVVAGLIGAFWNDGDAIYEKGFFQGYTGMTIAAILLQALGGLVVAAVLKYADNILKCFGNALSIVFSCIVSWTVAGDFLPSLLFCCGTAFVLLATYLYIVENPPLSFFRILKSRPTYVAPGREVDTAIAVADSNAVQRKNDAAKGPPP